MSQSKRLLTVESRLESGVLSRATFAVILVHDERPWLSSRLEPLSNPRDRIGVALGWFMVMVKCHVDVASFVVDSLHSQRPG